MTNDLFAQGMSAREYLEQMDLNRDRFARTLDATTLGAGDEKLLARFGSVRKVLAITEDWCGTSIGVLPYVFKLVEASPDVELRVFLRDANPELMDQYLKDGRHRSIPVVVIFDDAFTELARFIERRPA